MAKEMVVTSSQQETKIAILEDSQVVELYFERGESYSLAGSIYKGRVTRILPGMQSAFVNIGLERDAFLYVSDFLEGIEDFDQIETTLIERRPPRKKLAEEKTEQEPSLQREETVAEAVAPPAQTAPADSQVDSRVESPVESKLETQVKSKEQVSSDADGESKRGERPRRFSRRSRRGRRGQRERGFPDSKYASNDEKNTESAPEPVKPLRELKEKEAKETKPEEAPPRIVLPGETLAKYKDWMSPAENKEVSGLDEAAAGEQSSEQSPGQLPEQSEETKQAQAVAETVMEAVHEDDVDQVVSSYVNDNKEVEVADKPSRGSSRRRGRGRKREPEAEITLPAGADQASESAESSKPPELSNDAEEAPLQLPEPEIAATAEASVAKAEPGQDQWGVDLEEREQEENLDPEPGLGFEMERISRTKQELPVIVEDFQIAEDADAESEARRRVEAEAGAAGESAEAGDAEEGREAAVRPRPGNARLQRREKWQGRRPGRRTGGSQQQRGRTQDKESSPRPLIGDLLKEGQEIIVQIAKEPLGKKGARITSHVALPGRYVVYMPTLNHIGVSRKVGTDQERLRLKKIMLEHTQELSGGFIVRTAAEGTSEQDLVQDIQFLTKLWNEIKMKSENAKAPTLLNHDPDLVLRTLRDQLSSEFTTIWVDNEQVYEQMVDMVQKFQPALVGRVRLYTKTVPLFEETGVQDEINKALKPKVWLKSGGYIVINQTEALVAIDVNTGKYVGKSNRLEDTIVKTNIEAIQEVVRQIRLRDLGGIIVIDFIDMDERRNRHKVLGELEAEMRLDRAPSKVLSFNEFGLVAITRKRVRQSLERMLCDPCPYCNSAGWLKSPMTVSLELLGEARKMADEIAGKQVTIRVNPEVGKSLKSENSSVVEAIEEITGKGVIIRNDPTVHAENFYFA